MLTFSIPMSLYLLVWEVEWDIRMQLWAQHNFSRAYGRNLYELWTANLSEVLSHTYCTKSNILPVHGSFIWTFFLLLLYIFQLLFTESSTDFPCFIFANTLFILFNRTEANGLKLWVTFPCYGLLCICCCIEACHTHAWLFINHYYSKLPQTD